MRRAWSSALFQTLEALESGTSLGGACSQEKWICFVSVSDPHLAMKGISYRLLTSKKNADSLKVELDSIHAGEFSDYWYYIWWKDMMASKKVERPGSKGSAEGTAKSACEHYIQATAKIIPSQNRQPTSCTVLLATDKSIYIEIDTPFTYKPYIEKNFIENGDFVSAMISNIYANLAQTIGEAFDSTGYNGQVIVKSPWTNITDGPQERNYVTLDVKDLEFLFDEIQSGMSKEEDSHVLLLQFYRSEGQTIMNSLLRPDQKGGLIIRQAAVVTISFGQDNLVSLRTTDGTEWRISNQDMKRCDLSPGSEVSILALPERPVSISASKNGISCKIDAQFVTGW
jgi:hypothetical protein